MLLKLFQKEQYVVSTVIGIELITLTGCSRSCTHEGFVILFSPTTDIQRPGIVILARSF
jgi:hypothetical protein